MSNIPLWSSELDVVESLIVSEESDGLTIKIKDQEPITINYHHDQNCCERVYADFSNVKHHSNRIVGKNIKLLEIKGVPQIGFLLCFYNHDSYPYISEKILVPCYNEQNGYYSSDLELEIKQGEKITKIDITRLIENIDG